MTRLALCLVIQEIGGPIDPGFGNIGGIGGVDPGYGQGGGFRPDNSLPGFPGYPSQGLPGSGARPDQGLPGSPGHPANRPPGSGGGGLPTHPIYHPDKPVPPGQSPGAGLWVVAYVPGQGFKWVSVTPGVPEKPQPKPPGGQVDNTLPTVPVDPAHPDHGLPAGPDNTLPPGGTPQPKS